MSIEIPEPLKKSANIFGKGVLIKMAPGIAQGILVEIMRARKVDVDKATLWVENNYSLWGSAIDEKQKRTLIHLSKRLGNWDWMTTDWAIDALKKDFPAVASLFLGWKKANNWLGRQLEVLKEEIKEEA